MAEKVFNRPSDNYVVTASRLRAGANNNNLRLSTANNEAIIDLCNNGNVDISASTVFVNGFKVVTTSSGDATSLTALKLANNLDVSGVIRSDGGIQIGAGIYGGTITKSSNPYEIVIDPFATDACGNTQDASGQVTIMGDLVVRGNSTTIYSTQVDISDILLTLASGSTSSLGNNAGIQLGTGYASLLYNTSINAWKINIGLDISGLLSLKGNINYNGNVLPLTNSSKLPVTFNTFAVTTTNLNQDLLYGDVSANIWMDASGYITGMQVLSTNSYIKIDVKVAYTASPEADQTLSFRVIRGGVNELGTIFNDASSVFTDISLGSNMGTSLNDIYKGSFYDNLNGATFNYNAVYYKLQFRRDCPPNDTISRPFGIRGSTGNYFAIQELYTYPANSVSYVIDYANSTITLFGQEIFGEANTTYSGYNVSLSEDGTIMAISAPYNNGSGTLQGSTRIYKYNDVSWVKLGQDIDGEANNDQQSNVMLSKDGTIVAISSFVNSGTGSARVFKYNDISWIKQGQDIDGTGAGDEFAKAFSLSANGKIIATGASKNDTSYNNAGQVCVYSYNDVSWIKIGTFNGFDASSNTGRSVSLSNSGTILAISSSRPDNHLYPTRIPRVDVYELSNNVWTPKGPTIYGPYPGNKGSMFGNNIVLSSDGAILAISDRFSPNDEQQSTTYGRALVYKYTSSDNSWNRLGSDISGPVNNGGVASIDPYIALSADGTIMAVSYISDSTYKGLVRLYKFTNNNWIKIGTDISGDSTNTFFGNAIALSSSGSILAIGIPLNSPSDSGIVRTYKLNYAYTT